MAPQFDGARPVLRLKCDGISSNRSTLPSVLLLDWLIFFLCLQPVIRLYAVPLTAFSVEEDDDGEGFEGEEHEFTS